MDLIQFEAGTKVSDAKVTINGVDYPVTPARYTGNTPLSVYVLNLMQSNIAKAVVPTGGTTGQVLVKKSNADNDVEWQTGGGGGASGDTFPIGAISEYAGATAPTNWLICDGSAISRTTYADLFNVIGTRYGTGDGSTTFNLPDLRGRVPVGLDSNDTDFNTLGNTGGEKKHTLTIAEMPSHQHKDAINVGGSQTLETVQYLGGKSNAQYYVNTSAVGGGQAHNIMQPYIVQNYIIKAFQSSGVVANVVQAKSNSTTDVYSCDYVNKFERNIITAKGVSQEIETISSGSKVTLSNAVIVGNKLTINDGGIKIGSGVSKVLINASTTYTSSSPSQHGLIIYKNSKTDGNRVARMLFNCGSNIDIQPTIDIPNQIIEVSENDILYLYASSSSNKNISGALSYMTVEVVD